MVTTHFRTAILVVTLLLFGASVFSAPRISRVGFRAGMSRATLSNDSTNYAAFINAIDLVPLVEMNHDSKSRMGVQFGGFAVLSLGSKLSIQTELLYTSKGIDVEAGKLYEVAGRRIVFRSAEKISLNYLEIPVLVKLSLSSEGKARPSLFAGPALAFKLSGTYDLDFSWTDSDYPDIGGDIWGESDISNMESLDVGFVFGGDLAIAAGSFDFVLDVRYTLGKREVFYGVHGSEVPFAYFDQPLPFEYPIVDFLTGETFEFKNRALSIMLGVAFPL